MLCLSDTRLLPELTEARGYSLLSFISYEISLRPLQALELGC